MIYVIKHREDGRTYPEGYQELKVGPIYDGPIESMNRLNPYINELTGLNDIWELTDDEVVGLCHYRRFFMESRTKILSWEYAQELAQKYDMIVAPSYSFLKPLRENIIDHMPRQQETVDKYLQMLRYLEPGTREYFRSERFNPTNMFIAKREVMDDYCLWLFPIITAMACRFEAEDADKDNNPAYKRLIGYIGERLLTYYIQKEGLKVKEWPVEMIEGGSR